MKKATAKISFKSFPMKQTNVRFMGADQRTEPTYEMEDDSVIRSQEDYIENLQQQIYVLENEIGYLQTHLQESNKQHPSLIAEGEKIIRKLGESQKEIQKQKLDLKRKQTSVDLYRSERDRMQRHMDELEESFRKDKTAVLEELILTRKERESFLDKTIELERLLKEEKLSSSTLEEDCESLGAEVDSLKRELMKDKEILGELLESKEKLQKELFEARTTLDSRPSNAKEEVIKEFKLKLAELHEQLEGANRMAEHEHLLRERLADDNAQLIKRHAELEADLAEARALLREEQSLRASLEQIHLSTVLDVSEAKSRDLSLRENINRLSEVLKQEKEHSFQLTLQLAEEQRLRMREEQKVNHLQERFDNREEKMKAREKENTELLRDKTFLKEQVQLMKQQVQERDKEVLFLKEKVQDMQVSVEEFIQNSQAAHKVEGERWKQLNHLAQGIQALASSSQVESDPGRS